MALNIADLKQADFLDAPHISHLARTALEQLSATSCLAHQLATPSFAKLVASMKTSALFSDEYQGTLRKLMDSTKPINQWMAASDLFQERHKRWIEPALRMNSLVADIAKSAQGINRVLESCSSIASLATMGESLARLFPYENSVTDLLRSNLGDWRSVELCSQDSYLTEAARGDLYKSVGFDFGLTDMARETFVDSMSETGIRMDHVPAPVEAYGSQPAQEFVIVLPAIATSAPPENTEAYQLLWTLETRLREFIDRSMARNYGEDWHKRGLAPEVLKEWRRKLECDVNGGMEAQPLICYADFTDYERIITRRDHWSQVFCGAFKRRESVTESFNRLRLVRTVVMHARPLSNEDLLTLHAEVRRMLRAIGFVSH